MYTGNGWSFNLEDVKQYTDFTQLFDQYKITGVKMTFRLMTNPDAGSNQYTNVQIYPSMWYCTDYDDDTPITLDQMKEKQGVKRAVLRPGSIISMFIRPRQSYLAYQGITFPSGYSSTKAGWVDSNSPNVQHYGLKTVVDSEGVGQVGQYFISVEAKYYIACKGAQ